MSHIEELQKDLDELVKLQEQAQRKKVKDLLATEVSRVKALIETVYPQNKFPFIK